MCLSSPETFQVSAPLPITLFGEHQGLLGLPRISIATNLRVEICARQRSDGTCSIQSPAEGVSVEAPLSEIPGDLPVLKLIRRIAEGLATRGSGLARGYDFRVLDTGIDYARVDPLAAKAVCWAGAILRAAGAEGPENVREIARLAFESLGPDQRRESRQYDCAASALGGLLEFDGPSPESPTGCDAKLRGLVLGHTEEDLDNHRVLEEKQNELREELKTRSGSDESLDFRSRPTDQLYAELNRLPEAAALSAFGNTVSRDACAQAIAILRRPLRDPHELGRLLDEQHDVRRDYWGLSTPKQEALIQKAKEAGAVGCSGYGTSGGFVAYAPARHQKVAKVIEKAGGTAIAVKQDEGLRFTRPT